MIDLPPPLSVTDEQFPVASFNKVLDALAELQNRADTPSRLPRGYGGVTLPGQTLCRVTPDHDAMAGEALQLCGLTYSATEHEQQTTTVNAKRPEASEQNIVVCLDGIPTGTTGQAVQSGFAWCEVDILDTAHQYVTIGPDGIPVTAAASGWGWMVNPAPDAPDHPGTGKRWCLVRLPAGGGGGAPAKAIYVRSQASAGTMNASYVSMGPDVDASQNWDAASTTHTTAIFLGTSPISG